MKETRSYTKEVFICDSCKSEQDHEYAKCEVCQKELCRECTRNLRVSVHLHIPTSPEGSFGITIAPVIENGLEAYLCLDHASKFSELVRKFGFKDYEIKPPIPV